MSEPLAEVWCRHCAEPATTTVNVAGTPPTTEPVCDRHAWATRNTPSPRVETQAQREVRWARERIRQAAYRASPEAQAIRAERIRTGLCVLESGQCITHGVPDSMAHHFDAEPGAYND